MKINAEELAAKRFPQVEGEPLPLVQRAYYAEGITEVAQPLQDRVEELEAALVNCAIPYEAILMDAGSQKWIAPEIWQAMTDACVKARAILAKHA